MSPTNEKRIWDLCIRAARVWGPGLQLWIVVEELGELLAALAQHIRGRVDTPAVLEEIADARIVLFQLAVNLDPMGPAKIEKIMAAKLARLERRIAAAEERKEGGNHG